MKTINLSFCKSTGFDPFFDDISKSIVVPDQSFAGGGFGDIYEAISFDGKKAPLEQVVKVFKDDNKADNEKGWETIQLLQSRIMEEKAKLESNGKVFLDEYPALAALPQLVFEGKMGNKTVRGHVTINLGKVGCKSFEKILGTKESLDEYLSRDSDERLIMAYQFAKGFEMLHKVKYIHADINEDNLFISEKEPLCIILDYDSGAVIRSLDDNPSTIGKNRSWSAPEILMKLADNYSQRIEMTHWMDLWSIAHALHFVLTGLPPTYLETVSKTTYKAYISKYPDWPQIDPKDPMFKKKNVELYKLLLQMIDSEMLPKRLMRLFRSTFIDGFFQPAFRISVEDWASNLKKEVSRMETPYDVPQWTAFRKFQKNFPKGEAAKQSKSGSINVIKNVSADTPTNLVPDTDNDNLKELVKELLPGLISGKERLSKHKSYIVAIANMNHLDGQQFVQDLEDFIKLFNDSIKDKVISRLEYSNLMYQASLLEIERKTLDELLKPYKRK